MDIEPGSIITVKNWPGTDKEKFQVKEIREVPGSEYPMQVDAWSIDSGHLTNLRTFPLENCVIDKKTKRRPKK